MHDDRAAMSHRAIDASSSFSEDDGKADADQVICVSFLLLPPFFWLGELHILTELETSDLINSTACMSSCSKLAVPPLPNHLPFYSLFLIVVARK